MQFPIVLFEPIEIELDKNRQFKLNRRRGGSEWLSIDFLILSAAKSSLHESGSFPLDLLTVLLWAGLVEAIAGDYIIKVTEGKLEPVIPLETVPDLLDASPLPRFRILTLIWEYYLRVTTEPGANANFRELQPSF
ncbi:MAG: hypothetical protein ACREQO_22615 [Candidatus Binatia bacterium]